MWDFLEGIFDLVDTSGDGAIDADELKAAMAAHEKKAKKGKGKALLGMKEGPELTDAQI